MVSKSFQSESGVGSLIQCILDYVQRHLVDFWKKSPANFNFIWLEGNSYNSSIQLYIVWSPTSIFKLKSSPAQGDKWNWKLRSSFKKTKYILWALRVKMSLLGIKTKFFIIQNWFLECCLFFYLKHFRLCAVPSGGFFKKEDHQFQFHLIRVK